MNRSNVKTKELILCALFTALTAVCSQIIIPLPMIPINLALFSVHLSGALLGAKYGSSSMIVYVALGALGAPVFAGFMGGLGYLFGKTGGYIIGYIICALVVGYLAKKGTFDFKHLCLYMVIGLLLCYIFGTVWFMLIVKCDIVSALMWCVIPFLPGDAVKIALAAFLAVKLKPVLTKVSKV